MDNRANGTRSGFLLKKYLKGSGDQVWDQVVTPFVDLRYAEVLLNYAEAVAESNLPNAEGVITAQEALNKVHHRAGFLDNLALTSENVRRERKLNSRWNTTRSGIISVCVSSTPFSTGRSAAGDSCPCSISPAVRRSTSS